MSCARWLLPLLAAPLLYAGRAADLAHGIAQSGLDPENCYRIRDLTLTKGDLRLYFTDGYMIFGKPLDGDPITAVFVTTVQGGDAEIMALPPNRGERQSLSSFTQSPNLDEHFNLAVLLFTDQTYRDLMGQIGENPANKKSAEMGLALAPEWTSVARNLTASFEGRLALDLLAGRRAKQAFFFAGIAGRQLGNFDAIYDARASQQITIGQAAWRNDRAYFDVWTSFQARPLRTGTIAAPTPEFELSDFRISAALLPPDLRVQAVTRVKVKPASGGGRVFPFDLSRSMRVTAASVDGRAVEIFEPESLRSNLIHDRGNGLVLLIPPEPLTPGKEYEFEFHHEGAVIANAGNKVYTVGSRANWYPSRGLQFAKFDLTFRYPNDLDLVSSGAVVSDTVDGDWRVTRRKVDAPVRLVGFNLGVYQREKISRGGQTVEVCANRSLERALEPKPSTPTPIGAPPPMVRGRGRPQQPATGVMGDEPPPVTAPGARLRELAEDVASALDFMSARFGPPPLSTLTVSPAPGMYGQGFPGLIYLSTLSYLAPANKSIAGLRESDKLFFSEMLYAHETAHQWWGNLVTSSGYQNDWLLEALANYSALLYLEKHKGIRAMDSILSDYRDDLMAKVDGRPLESAGPIALGLRLESSLTPKAWRTIVYEKGTWILHMLRRRMGDDQFVAFLGELSRRFEWKSLDVESFRLLAASFLPAKSPDPKLGSFFDQWVYGTGIPTLRMTSSLTGKPPAQKLTVTVEQTGVDDEFSVMAPVEIQFRRAKSITRLVRTSSEPAVFTIPVPQPPSKVALDPANSVLAVKK